VFTASGSPSNVAGVRAAVQLIRDHPELRHRLWANIRRLREGLQKLGFQIGSTESPIVPVRIGTAERAIQFWRMLLERGLYVNIVLPPACHADASATQSTRR
jgi:8-amino-7-oxononanoate synthase